MRRWRRFLIGMVAAAALYGCPGPVEFVAVRERCFRSEDQSDQRIKLPLEAADRERLVKFLKAGGNADNVGAEIVEPDAEGHYAPLLDRLSDPGALALEDLLEGKAYEKWFECKRIRQVIDARESTSPTIDPVAATDGRYWWIFFHHHHTLNGLLVVKAIPTRKPD